MSKVDCSDNAPWRTETPLTDLAGTAPGASYKGSIIAASCDLFERGLPNKWLELSLNG